MRGLVRGLILATVLLSLFGVPWWTLVGSADWPVPVVVIGTSLFALSVASFPVLMYLGHSRRGQDWAARISDTMLGAVWVMFVWSVIGQVLVLTLLGVDDPTRSRIVASVVGVAVLGLLAWGHYEAMRVPRIKRVDVTIPRLGEGFDGATLAVVSDTHYGPINRTRWSEKVVAAINKLDADIVVHAGDIADGTPVTREQQVGPLETIHSRLARVYATGNHEYFSEAQDWLDHMTKLGWDSLHNRHIVVSRGGDNLVLAGVDDYTAKASKLDGHGADLAQALAGADPDLPVVLLAHQPKQIGVAVEGGVDLQISGHTHGGQIWPFHYLVRLDQPSVHGLTRHSERTQLYTTRGSGFWGPPFRIFAPSEITLITLHR